VERALMLLAGQGVGVSAGGEWQPTGIPDLVSYFDSRYGVALSGSNITTWTASRGLAYQFATSSASFPQYAAAGWVGTRRTLPSFELDVDAMTSSNTIGGLTLAQRLLGGTDQPGTILLVYQFAAGSVGADKDFLSFTNASLGTSGQCFAFAARDAADNVWRTRHRDNSLANKVVDGAIAGGALDTNKHVMAWAISAGTGQALEQRLDDVVVASGDLDLGTTDLDRVTLGQFGAGFEFGGRIAAVGFWSRRLTSAELTAAFKGSQQIYL
jgi:hypothetical protein